MSASLCKVNFTQAVQFCIVLQILQAISVITGGDYFTPQANRMVLLSAIAYRACTVTLTLGCLLVCYRLCNAFRDSLVPFTNTVHSLVLAIPADALSA